MHIHPCPKCGTSLGALGANGVLQAVCATCRLKFQVMQGRVLARGPGRITMQRLPRLPAIARPDSPPVAAWPVPLETLVIFVPDPDDRGVVLSRGEDIVVTHGMRGDELHELLTIENVTTGALHTVTAVGADTARRASCLAMLATAASVFVLVRSGLSGTASLVASLLLGAALLWYLTRRFAPVHPLSPDMQLAITHRQSLLRDRRRLEARRRVVEGGSSEKRALRDRLQALRDKMQSVGLPSYAPRIASIDEAVRLLEQQLELDRRLLAAYDRSIAIVEIEYESGATPLELPAASPPETAEKLDELHALEAEHAEMSRRIAANAEVEQLMRDDTA
jgi:hypothetical protein